MQVALEDHEAELEPATPHAIARGANRLLVGSEIVQFAQAQPVGEGVWELTGLLRGRGGNEIEALAGHVPGTLVTLLDDRLVELPATLAISEGSELAAIGSADPDPVVAPLENGGRTRRPLFPVQPRVHATPGGGLILTWTRRARGGWSWLDEVEQPLVEQAEAYEVGLGDPDKPHRVWATPAPHVQLASAGIAALSSLYPGQSLWVRQKGSFALSAPLHLTHIPASS